MAWMANEIFAEGGSDVAIKVTPAGGGLLEVYAGGDKIYDKAAEGGNFPDLTRVKEMRAAVRERL